MTDAGGPRRGRFITLEGGEGAGKSTQGRLLAEALRARGFEVVLTREPGGTPGAEAIRALLLTAGAGRDVTAWAPRGSNVTDWSSRAEALLFAAARSDHVEKLIQPALFSGAWVICDRFLDSSRAYQGGGFISDFGITDDEILKLHAIGSAGIMPDLTLLITVSPELSLARLHQRDAGKSDRIGGRDALYHARVRAAFDRIANAERERYARIDGDASIEDVHQEIMLAIEPLLSGEV